MQALPAAISAPQPSASNVACSIRPPPTRSAIRTRSLQAAPPALPTTAPSGTGSRPRGWFRWRSNASGCTQASIGTAVAPLALPVFRLRVLGSAVQGVHDVLLDGVGVQVARCFPRFALPIDNDERRGLRHVHAGRDLRVARQVLGPIGEHGNLAATAGKP